MRAGGDFAEELVGHWLISSQDPEALKAQIRKHCVPKSRLSTDTADLRAKIEPNLKDAQTDLEMAMDNIWEGGSIAKSFLIHGQEKIKSVLSILEAEEKCTLVH